MHLAMKWKTGVSMRLIFFPFILLMGFICCVGCTKHSKGGDGKQDSQSESDTQSDTHTDTQTETATDSTTDTDSQRDSDSMTDTVVLAAPGAVAFNEAMSKNEGVVLDDALESEDWIELIGTGTEDVRLSEYSLVEDGAHPIGLPDIVLHPKETVLLFLDRQPEQGPTHLDLKLSSEGERIWLLNSSMEVIDILNIPALEPNLSLARYPDGVGEYVTCRYATPGKPNGAECTPPAPRGLEAISFEPWQWPADALNPVGPVVITELSLRPANFIEVLNISDSAIALETYTIELAPHAPGLPWPQLTEGESIALGEGSLQPGQRLRIAVTDVQAALLEASPLFEGVATLFDGATVVDRVDFMSWPQGSALARIPDGTGLFTYCNNATPDAPNTCEQTPAREVGNRLRYLRTPTDFEKLATGGAMLGIGSVKFVVDLEGGNAVHLLSSWDWDLHYTFIREVIDGEPPLDRCDPAENNLFNSGWQQFSNENYFTVEGRRYLLGTLSHHSGADLHCVEYTFGDEISPEQMLSGYFNATAHTNNPGQWVLRPQDDPQVNKARAIEGQLPIVGPTAPFAHIQYQTLAEGVGYGTLVFIDAADLSAASLGPNTIVVTNDVPNDIPFVGGIITEAFQTPLSHVNILSKSRNTPNIAVWQARTDPRIAPFLDTLVKFEVFPTHFEISPADPVAAQAHWDQLIPNGPTLAPLLDTAVRGVVPLGPEIGFEHRGSIGAKAAQLSEMTRITDGFSRCSTTFPLPTPKDAFAIPVAHFLDHFTSSGAKTLFEKLMVDEEFQNNPEVRAAGLAQVRTLILGFPVETTILADVTNAVFSRFGTRRVRFRSSSNTEDLQEFNGAGIYSSQSGQIGDSDLSLENAMRIVWASLWNDRAFDERRYAHIDHTQVAMGILVHEAFLSEEANGVAVSRDIYDVERGDRYYVNVQAGEASVANPAPGVTTEQVIYQWPSRTPTLRPIASSSLVDGPVLWNSDNTDPSLIRNFGEIDGETREVVCALRAIHNHFEALLDPQGEQSLFTMEIEFKFSHEDRDLVVKQTRPYSFGDLLFPLDCREL